LELQDAAAPQPVPPERLQAVRASQPVERQPQASEEPRAQPSREAELVAPRAMRPGLLVSQRLAAQQPALAQPEEESLAAALESAEPRRLPSSA
jgi:hypothetical protein